MLDPARLSRRTRPVAADSGADAPEARRSWTPEAARTVGVVRAALVIAVAVGAVIDDRPAQYPTTFYVVLALAAVAAGAALALGRLGHRWSKVYAALDLIFLAALAHSSGGADSEVRFAFFAIPVLAAMLFRPRATLIASLAVLTTYLTLALTQTTGDIGQDQQLVYVELVYLAWAAIAAVLLSRAMTRRADKIAELARARGRLMADVLDAEDRERRRLANWLHDGAVQNLLVAGQDLGEAEGGDPLALQRARGILRDTIPQLRNVLVDLHPGLLTSTGLAPALRALADAQAQRASFRVEVSVEEAVEGVHDQLLLSLTRELLINVVKHARAREVRVSVRRHGHGVELEVSDDGRGFDITRRSEAVADGHIGLASSAERVERLGGRMEIESSPGHGTHVRAVIPGEAQP